MSDKFYYKADKYLEDLETIKNYVKINGITNVVGIYRGSLPLAVAISNKCEIPMSMIDFQTKDGDSKEPSILKQTFNKNDKILVVDDIYDTGKTLNIIDEFLKEKGYNNINYLTLFKADKTEPKIPLEYLNISNKWVVFEVWE